MVWFDLPPMGPNWNQKTIFGVILISVPIAKKCAMNQSLERLKACGSWNAFDEGIETMFDLDHHYSL